MAPRASERTDAGPGEASSDGPQPVEARPDGAQTIGAQAGGAQAGETGLEERGLGGTVRAVGANQPLALSAGDCLLVEEGHVDLFAVRAVDGALQGPRHSLFRALAGDLAIGWPAPPAAGRDGAKDGGYMLLAVGNLGARVRVGADLSALPAGPLANKLDRFVAGLLGCVDRVRPGGASAVVVPDTQGELYRDMAAFAAGRQPVWLTALDQDGTLRLFGEGEAAAACLPVTAAAWAETDTAMRYRADSGAALVAAQGDWRPKMTAFLSAYHRVLIGDVAAHDAASARRLSESEDAERNALDGALRRMVAVIGGDDDAPIAAADIRDLLHGAFAAVARAAGVADPGTDRRDPDRQGLEPIEALALSYRVRVRKVILRDDWMSADNGPLLAFWGEGQAPVALLPAPRGGYAALDPATGSVTPLTDRTASALNGEAWMIYRPLPDDSRKLGDLIAFILPRVRGDLRRVALVGLMGGLLAAFTPMMTGHLIESVLPRADMSMHGQIILALTVAAFGAASFTVVKAFALLRVEARADLSLQSALFDRLLRLPAGFFRRFTAGDLADRVLGVQTIRETLTGATLQSLLGVTFSSFSLALLFYYNWKLALLATGLVALSVGLIVLLGLRQLVHERARIALQGQAEGFILQVLSGIGKLRAAAAENRAYGRWAEYYTDQKRRFVRAQTLANLQDLFQAVFPIVSVGLIFIMAAALLKEAATQQQIEALVAGANDEEAPALMSTGDFVAFNTAFGQFLVAMTALAGALTRSLAVIPLFERLRPVIEAQPEAAGAQRQAVRLGGGLEINQVDFRYASNAPLVLNGLTFSIAPNEFVAIVGPSGSGKSTLVRLLLGFDECESGEILFDGTPIDSLDLSALRRQMRVVLQASRPAGGSILSNITGGGAFTEQDAWRAAKLAGLDAEIEALPMGMHTIVTEGVNTLSGGQRQRLMLAGALIHRPAILVLDEPTSALDNKSQALVMESLTRLNATRLLIAHRLSTVRNADRILVMEAGRVVEQGDFDSLIAADGPFAEMAKRQLV